MPSDDAVARRTTEVVQRAGGCGAISPGGDRVCIKDAGLCPPHGWEGHLSVSTEASAADVVDGEWRNLALLLIAELSWCVGFVEQVGECVPASTRSVLQQAIDAVTTRKDGI